ncbi:MAG: hypothetical protein AB8G22_01380 [Saprospiraceae bacterium]
MNHLSLFPKGIILPVLFSLFLLTSCDPGQILRIENQANSEANIQFVFKTDKAIYEFEDLRTGDTLNLKLAAAAENSVKEFHFGIGHWQVQGMMDSLVQMVESLEIQTAESTQTYQGTAQLEAFFKERITGRMEEVILITVE